MLRVLSRFRAPLQFIHQTLISISPPSSTPQFSHRPPPHTFTPFSPFTSRRRKGSDERKAEEDDNDDDGIEGGAFVFGRDPTSPPKLFVVQPRFRPESLLQSKLSEALNLANSLEEQRDGLFTEEFDVKQQPSHLVVQNPAARSLKADTYFGSGTVDDVKCHIKALESENGTDAVFVNAILSGIQQRNLEIAWGKPVLDRVALIIEIFNAHAETKEAKLQSELAALMYKKTRLVRVRGPGGRLTFGASGESEVVSARGRGSGGRGFISGAGETELQLQRRRILERRNRLLVQIEEVRRTRALQRYARKRRGGAQGHGLATVAIVGYTNAGKSTLVSALSQSDLFSDDRLFATVDPRLRSVILPSGKKAILSDTVGFISDLPIQLVEAFHATLEEVVEADLLVHVLDSSAPNLDEHRSTVLQVLQQIGVKEEKIQNMIEVWNKIDLMKGEEADDSFEKDSMGENDDEDDEKLLPAEDNVTSEPLDRDDFDAMDSELSSCEQQYEPSKDWEVMNSSTLSDLKCGQHVETSAVTGVGLQELLSIIDEKLSAQRSSEEEKENLQTLDRKWRPPSTEDFQRAAE